MNLTLALIGANFLGTTVLATLVLRKRSYTGNGETLAKLNVAVMRLTDAVTALNLEVDLLKQKAPLLQGSAPVPQKPHGIRYLHSVLTAVSAGLVTLGQTQNWHEALAAMVGVGFITRMIGEGLRDFASSRGNQ